MRMVENFKDTWRENKVIWIVVFIIIGLVVVWNVVEFQRIQEWYDWNASRPNFSLTNPYSWEMSYDINYYKFITNISWANMFPNSTFSVVNST